MPTGYLRKGTLPTAVAIVSVAFFAAGYWGSRPAGGYRADDVWFVSDDGVRIHGRLYEPAAGLPARAPGVVVAHGYPGNLAVMEVPISLELARRGFAVLAMDYPGHGRSAGGIRARHPGEVQSLARSQPAVHAAIQILRARPGVDPDRIGIVGHSEGAKAAAEAASADWRVWATVCIAGSGAHPYVSRWAPRNLLLVYGSDERFVPRIDAVRLWERATGGASFAAAEVSDDFAHGRARKLVLLSGRGHFGTLFDRTARAEVVAWLETALAGSTTSPVTADPIGFGWIGLGIAGLLLGFVPLLAILDSLLGTRTATADLGRGSARLPGLAYRLAVFAGSVWAAVHWLETFRGAFGWLPVSGGDWYAAAFTALGAAQLALLPLAARPATWRRMLRDCRSRFGRRWLAGVLVGAVCWLYVAAGLTALLSHSYYDLLLQSRRFALMGLFACLVAPSFLLWQVWVEIVMRGDGRTPRLAMVAAVLLGTGVYAAVAPSYYPGIRIVTLAVVAACLGLALLFAGPSGSRRTLVAPAVFQTLTAAWIVSALSPFY